ncbi:hypothetical protein E8E13_002911 [Curvularia kusanoi]|uniref:Uncharacterized protein n=1 Tax=Curvularia kusanoi TaxID=90978 RepID=A0A9P4W340_CURKU|nr:hypothetical protein E8E13_002911 [Curvularia kusanoi]
MSNTNQRPPPPPPLRPGQQPFVGLQCYRRAFVLLLLYIPLVVVPWVVTMILVYRPTTLSSWPYVDGVWKRDYQQMRAWATAIPIMNAFAAVLAVPVTSAIVAQAAVVFAQRRRTPWQNLSVRHLFALADRPWVDWDLLHQMMFEHEKGSTSVKRFVFGGVVLVVCGAIQYPLSQIVVSWDQISLPTCHDTSHMDPWFLGPRCDMESTHYSRVGYDLEPAQMVNLPAPRVLPHIVEELSRVQSKALSHDIWPAQGYLPGHEDGFVAALPADTTTGVLREHVMRLNSSVSCTNLSMSEWPSSCPGANPFQASFEYYDVDISKHVSMNICAPGDSAKHPWTLSRNRQNLSEEVFFRLAHKEDSMLRSGVMHCTAQTSRGYFELGNIHNGQQYGPLLEEWPNSDEFHDFMASETADSRGYRLSEEDNYSGSAQPVPDKSERERSASEANVYTQLPGPLMTSVLALFGQHSWANNVVNLTAGRSEEDLYENTGPLPEGFMKPLCNAAPFASAYPATTGGYCLTGLYGLRRELDHSLSTWDLELSAQRHLSIAMYVANLATLTSHLDGNVSPWSTGTGREIYAAEGLKVWKPRMALPAQIILTIIVSVHVLGLLLLGWWIQRWPAWTRTLDSMAIARVAASLDPSLLPPIKTVELSAREPLADIDGLVGIQREAGDAHESLQTQLARVTPAGDAPQTDVEMETLSIASTAGKQATSFAVPIAASSASISGVTFGLGAPGCIAKRGKKQVAPSARDAADV